MDENVNKSIAPLQNLDAGSASPLNPEISADPEKKPVLSRAAWIGFILGIVIPSVLLVPVTWSLLGPDTFLSEPDILSLNPLNFDLSFFNMLDAGIILLLSSAVMAVASIIYLVNITVKKTPILNIVWIIASASYSVWFVFAFIRLSFYYGPLMGEQFLFLSALCMIIILVSMVGALLWTAPGNKKRLRGKPLLLVLVIPVLWYIALNLGMYAVDGDYVPMWVLIFVAVVYVLIFLILRGIFLVFFKNGSGNLPLQIIILFILPSLGLLVSQTFDGFSFFWDFSSPVYYLLVLINGVLIMLPEPSRAPLRVLLLFARGAAFLFAFYFFMCLSPYYALALPAIIYYGIGLLILSPLFLIIYQTRILVPRLLDFSRDFGWVKTAAVFLLGMFVLPLGLILCSIGTRENIDTALSIINGYTDAGEVNLSSLRNSLNYMYSFDRNPPPFISSIYRYAATGGKILSDASYARAQALFFAESNSLTGRRKSFNTSIPRRSPDVKISDIKVETRQDGSDYKSMVHFAMENTGGQSLQEYATSFMLPDGVFISNYYLDVLGERKNGLLSVKQAATWMYNRVVSSSRDPGILYYDGDEITFKVFPFSGGETRYTGIEFLHKEPALLEIDNNKIALETNAGYLTSPVELDGAVYFGSANKERLASADRRPGYAFVIDCSKHSDTAKLINRLKQFCADNKINPAEATVTAMNYRSATFPMSGDWEKSVKSFSHEGGFGVDIVSDKLYKIHSDENTYPVMIVLSDNIGSALLPSDASYMSMRCPELDGYFVLSGTGMSLYPFNKYAAIAKIDAVPDPKPVLAAGNAILRDDGQPQIVIGEDTASSQNIAELNSPTWENGMRLAVKTGQLRFSSEQNRPADTIGIIKDSFATGIMTPQTSYIVLETPEQEAQLKARQQQLLDSGNLNGEDTSIRMSEPSMALCAVIILFAIWLGRYRNRPVKTINKAVDIPLNF